MLCNDPEPFAKPIKPLLLQLLLQDQFVLSLEIEIKHLFNEVVGVDCYLKY